MRSGKALTRRKKTGPGNAIGLAPDDGVRRERWVFPCLDDSDSLMLATFRWLGLAATLALVAPLATRGPIHPSQL